ncbi:MAG: hypothetical protein ACRDGM_20085 [bacterium]
MPSRQLTTEELAAFKPLLEDGRSRLKALGQGDVELFWAPRRKLAKELTYDERSKPMHRRALKLRKRKEQGGVCTICQTQLPERGAVLDRFEAMQGYTAENTRLICPACDTKAQAAKAYA